MSQEITRRITHTDLELMRLRMNLSPGQRLQAMLDARAVLVGIIRGRLRKRYPNLSNRELNLKILEEIERAQRAGSQQLGDEVAALWELIKTSAREQAARD